MEVSLARNFYGASSERDLAVALEVSLARNFYGASSERDLAVALEVSLARNFYGASSEQPTSGVTGSSTEHRAARLRSAPPRGDRSWPRAPDDGPYRRVEGVTLRGKPFLDLIDDPKILLAGAAELGEPETPQHLA